VITDKDAQFVQDKQVAGMNAMPPYIFLMRNYGLDEVTAKKWVEESKPEPAETNLFEGA
jgi:hypothetical protein